MVCEAMRICHRNKVIIYPEYNDFKRSWFIVVDSGNKKIIDKPLAQKKVNDALINTYIYYAKKL